MFSEEINNVSKAAKGKSDLLKNNGLGYFLASIFAGLYIGIGILLIFTAGGFLSASQSPLTKIVMGLSFGIALSLVIFAGAELFTGNNFVMSIGYLKKAVTFNEALKVWIVSFLGNLVGSIITAYLYFLSGLSKGVVGEFIVKTSDLKISGSLIELFIRGIFCNILVCLAVWMAIKMKSESGKLIMIFWCLFAFITIGFEHSVANMTLLSIGHFISSEGVTLGGVIYNLAVVTLGNFVGGGILLALPYYIISKES